MNLFWDDVKEFIVEKVVGKLLMLMGAIGIMINLQHDMSLGSVQLPLMVFFVIVGLCGYISDRYWID